MFKKRELFIYKIVTHVVTSYIHTNKQKRFRRSHTALHLKKIIDNIYKSNNDDDNLNIFKIVE